MSAALASTDVQPPALDAAAFARLSDAEAESFVAARYCALSEAGYSVADALAIARQTFIEVFVGAPRAYLAVAEASLDGELSTPPLTAVT